jgi:subtilisin-like proprotein convertase family protein
VKRLALLAGALLALGAGSAQAVTKEYSTGNINARIADRLDRSLDVTDSGPVSFVRVWFRITTPETSTLAISLVSPKGTEVPLVVNRGTGADFGSAEKSCGGVPTEVDSDMTTNPISVGSAPFTNDPYRPDGNLRSLYGEDARGKWTLRVVNTGSPATLHCLTLDISRDVKQTLSARHGAVQATVSFVERANFFERVHMKVVRRGHTVVDAPIQAIGCGQCRDFRPTAVKVRDLDGGEPEVLLDLYSGGAHCCLETLILRYDSAAGRYRWKLTDWGNYGSRLVDLDRDGLPEISAYDERFLYTFTAYVVSAAPVRIWRYRQGTLVDVTRAFPEEIAKSAADLAKSFLKLPVEKGFDARSYVAAYVADQYLLDRPAEAKRALDFALVHGELFTGKTHYGLPAGRSFIAVLMKDLRRWGYIRS